ncbi:hypothetical protein [Nocardiopsis composta]|uniref:Uncharacterized protein n=1 Tax=Nocardiopsis composta TaxID=157465 RepID=A0A7W8VCS2_9ACTN|nr:hypothetical protein [Nocardiopsis composta]MBB5431243.1 hypothetical protein [Nocardiopsis composta]
MNRSDDDPPSYLELAACAATVLCWAAAAWLLLGPLPWHLSDEFSRACGLMGEAFTFSDGLPESEECFSAGLAQLRTAVLWILASLPFAGVWAKLHFTRAIG